MKEELLQLFKAQDVLRRLWANTENYELGRQLHNLDKHLLQIINSIGDK